MKYLKLNLLSAAFVCGGLLSGCSSPTETATDDPYFTADEDQGGLTLGDGFQSYVIAEDLGRARHLAVRENGDIYVNLREANDQGGIAALRDTDGDGRADEIEYFSDFGGTGMAFYDGNLYASNDSTIFRYSFVGDNLLPENAEAPDTIVSGLPVQTAHAAKSFTFDDKGYLYVNVGAPSNACQEQDRTRDSPAMDPCPLLERHGGVWRFDASKVGQTQLEDGHRFSTGIRNAVALQFNPLDGHVYAVQHGRDMLNGLFPDMYTVEESVEQPAEEMFRLSDGADFGWPYCYFDAAQNKRVTSPEYGGDKQSTDRCEGTEGPIATFPAHMAPNDLLFYTGDQFPESYKGAALIAFHGSWNRAPLGQKGYFVAIQPFENGDPAGEYQNLAEGFAGVETIEAPSDAKHRPTGLAMAPDGTVIVSDSVTGKIWRVYYKEDKTMALK
ncbi:PQQ-dependent sugar dehydrogenase [Cyclobacterium qasimii]|uniref:L-sorbosone dehydrogenase n=2 Tax=Cyclobacterium qasimii TaxID=1350429 RepID=S7WLN8_9BACT|nr:PQQ-dependent sugar dehydrogenase [Cyclobacterium qasimii]EPR67654.1 L-sorbosone dehydrogenase [Cyclobacterium qasimii M12-11B]GEO19485.1 sorbosone dehydrogenase [Cyclobacterium qasimii]